MEFGGAVGWRKAGKLLYFAEILAFCAIKLAKRWMIWTAGYLPCSVSMRANRLRRYPRS
jgi:hypothetical protein